MATVPRTVQLVLLITNVLLITKCLSQELSCLSALNCGECISSPDCAWCSDPSWLQSRPRCDNSVVMKTNCPEKFLFDPINSIVTESPGDKGNGSADPFAESTLKISPIRSRVRLRPNVTTKLNLHIEQTRNYPVDLYYLMDLTYSMKDHKETLSALADQLGVEMTKITGKFRLGFGSFIDKVIMPFANMDPEKLKNPCLDGLKCVPAYGFQNHLPLTDNLTRFVSQVKSASLSANLDNAEGGFDALMQVLVCKSDIDWKPQHRRIILFATDSIFHYAGDGKLGGIVKPNDGLCHLDNQGFYSESLNQDYPSLEQINRAIEEADVNIIFAVPGEEAFDVYGQLEKHIEGAQVEKLLQDSSNILELIRFNYEKIASNIKLHDDAPDILQVKYFAKCGDKGEFVETSECSNFRVGDTVDFSVELTAMGCPVNKTGRYTFNISPVGLSEKIVVEVEVSCECECEAQKEPMSKSCSKRGSLVCGKCDCNAGSYGRRCECDGGTEIAVEMLNNCKKPNDDGKLSALTCSGRGDCECGQCSCHSGTTRADKIFGSYCECDTFSCARDPLTNLTCGGPSRGQCCNGHCSCYPGWSGAACDCTDNQETCEAPNGQLCSGHGRCQCGRCICANSEAGDIYAGTYCEQCLTCVGRCVELEDCVRCRFPELVSTFGDEGLLNKQDCESRCSRHVFDLVTELRSAESESSATAKSRQCKLTDAEGCHVAFEYQFDFVEERANITLNQSRECPTPVNFWVIIGSIAGSVAIIGFLIVILLRLLVYLKDKRDFAKWSSEVEQTKRDMGGIVPNPLYKEANTEYRNPMFKGGQ